MGSYNAYCHITGIPILPGQPAVACIVADNTAYGMAIPQIPPWFEFGVVNHYGYFDGKGFPESKEGNYDNPVMFHQEAFEYLERHLERTRPGYRAFVDAASHKQPLGTESDDPNEWFGPEVYGQAPDLPESFKGFYLVAMTSHWMRRKWVQDQEIPPYSVSDIIRAHWLGELLRETPCLGSLVPYARGAQEEWDDQKNITARSLHDLRIQIFGDFSVPDTGYEDEN